MRVAGNLGVAVTRQESQLQHAPLRLDLAAQAPCVRSRDYSDRLLGPGGTRLAQAAWGPVLGVLGTQPWNGPPLYVSSAASVFDAEGALVDEKVKQLLTRFMAGFVSFVDKT